MLRRAADLQQGMVVEGVVAGRAPAAAECRVELGWLEDEAEPFQLTDVDLRQSRRTLHRYVYQTSISQEYKIYSFNIKLILYLG